MKGKIFAALFSAALILGGLKAEAQHVYVKVAPHSRVVKRPKAPSSHHVWVGSEWTESGGSYVEAPGHWEVPPHGHHAWVAGHWAHEKRGSYWVAGHWS